MSQVEPTGLLYDIAIGEFDNLIPNLCAQCITWCTCQKTNFLKVKNNLSKCLESANNF